ncbi:hypothetical protein COT58_00465, partial [Candidatus Micrarchaeota archaeon CG09_land_8_20_14_0_10_60_16]
MRKALFVFALTALVCLASAANITISYPADGQTYRTNNGVLDLSFYVPPWSVASDSVSTHCTYALDSGRPSDEFAVLVSSSGADVSKPKALQGLAAGYHTVTAACMRDPQSFLDILFSWIPFIGSSLVKRETVTGTSTFNYVALAGACVDSDGDSPETLGTCSEGSSSTASQDVVRRDYCVDTATVNEFVCSAQSTCEVRAEPCKNGCLNGVCLTQALAPQTKWSVLRIPKAGATATAPSQGTASAQLSTGEVFPFHGHSFALYSSAPGEAWLRDETNSSVKLTVGGADGVFIYSGEEVRVKLLSQAGSGLDLSSSLEFDYAGEGTGGDSGSFTEVTVGLTIFAPVEGATYGSRTIALQYRLHDALTETAQPAAESRLSFAGLNAASFVAAPPSWCVEPSNPSQEPHCDQTICAEEGDYVHCCRWDSIEPIIWYRCPDLEPSQPESLQPPIGSDLGCEGNGKCFVCSGTYAQCYPLGEPSPYLSCAQQGYPNAFCSENAPSPAYMYTLCSGGVIQQCDTHPNTKCWCRIGGDDNGTQTPPPGTEVFYENPWLCAYSVDGGFLSAEKTVEFGSTVTDSFTVATYGRHDVQVFCKPVQSFLGADAPEWPVDSLVINFTVAAPDFSVTLYEPENRTYFTDMVPWRFQIDRAFGEAVSMQPTDAYYCEGNLDGLSWDKLNYSIAESGVSDLFPDGVNVTGSFNLTGLYGTHSAQVRCASTKQPNWGYSNQVNFTTAEPDVPMIVYPENKTYWMSALDLGFIVSGNYNAYACSYELDGVSRELPDNSYPGGVMLWFNALLAPLEPGMHGVSVTCQGTGASQPKTSDTVYFTTYAPGVPVIFSPKDGSEFEFDSNCTDYSVVHASYAVGGVGMEDSKKLYLALLEALNALRGFPWVAEEPVIADCDSIVSFNERSPSGDYYACVNGANITVMDAQLLGRVVLETAGLVDQGASATNTLPVRLRAWKDGSLLEEKVLNAGESALLGGLVAVEYRAPIMLPYGGSSNEDLFIDLGTVYRPAGPLPF